MARRIFISYSRKEKAAVDELFAQLTEAGHDVWRDLSVIGGSDWWSTIVSEISTRDTFLVAVSGASLASPACVSELSWASQLHRHLLPVRVADDFGAAQLSSLLARTQLIQFPSTPVLAIGLLRAISTLPAPNPLPDDMPLPPPAPLSYLTALRDRLDLSAPLSSQEQQETIAALREGCRRPDDVRDAQMMLQQLLRRPELLSRSADDIRETLLATEQRSTVPPPPPAWAGEPRVDSVPIPAAPKASSRSIWIPTLVVATLASLLGGFALASRAGHPSRTSGSSTAASTSAAVLGVSVVPITSTPTSLATTAPIATETTAKPEPTNLAEVPPTTTKPTTTTPQPPPKAPASQNWVARANALCGEYLPLVVQIINDNNPSAYADMAQVIDATGYPGIFHR